MKKFWRSGMIDKKIVKEREQAEYINKLKRTILELTRKPLICKPTKTPVKDAIMDSYSYWLRRNATKRCDADIEFGRKIEEIIKNANNTRTLRQEE